MGTFRSKAPLGKLVIADKGYRSRHEPTLSVPNPLDDEEVGVFKSRVRSKHETFNRRVKIFKILRETYRHGARTHKPVMEACAVITQYSLENGSPLFAL